jgi:cytochrome c oxidase cbb3-type subunit 4
MGEIFENLRALWVVWLMLLFIGIVVWVYWPSRRRRAEMQDRANIPFRDEQPRAEVGSDDTGSAGDKKDS